MTRRDQRSAEATDYRRLYKTSRWQAIRSAQLRAHPLCQACEAKGKVVPATICDHIDPHKGDQARFYEGRLQSLCKPCHDGAKQSEERRGYSTEIGVDGWPTDKRHPALNGYR